MKTLRELVEARLALPAARKEGRFITKDGRVVFIGGPGAGSGGGGSAGGSSTSGSREQIAATGDELDKPIPGSTYGNSEDTRLIAVGKGAGGFMEYAPTKDMLSDLQIQIRLALADDTFTEEDIAILVSQYRSVASYLKKPTASNREAFWEAYQR